MQPLTLEEAVQIALDGDAVLFLGSGFSLGAKNGQGRELPTADRFANHLAELMALPIVADLPETAERFVDSRGQNDLNQQLVAEFRVTSVEPSHRVLAGIPWRRVYTTNYDNVFEMAASMENRPARSVTLSEKPSDISIAETAIIHLNGYVERINSTVGDEIRLTDTSYVTTSVEHSPWSAAFRQDLETSSATFFIGYSIDDLEIAQLIARVPNIQSKCFFIIGPDPKSKTEYRAKNYGTPIRNTTDWLADVFRDARSTYNPERRKEPTWHCLREFKPQPTDSSAVTDSSVYSMLSLGYLNEKLTWNSFEDISQPYVLKRDLLTIAKPSIKDTSKILVVHSALGNGKTLFLEGLKWIALKSGVRVFSLSRRSPFLDKELSALASLPVPTLLLIDDYQRWFDALKMISMYKLENLSIALTARTSAHDVSIGQLDELFPQRDINEHRIDKLSYSELKNIDSLLKSYGLLGEHAGKPQNKRINRLIKSSNDQWHSILIESFDSPQIKSKMELIVNELNNNGSFYEIVTGILALTITNARPSINILVDIFGSQVLDRKFQLNPVVSEFINFKQNEVRCQSSVAARSLLSQIIDPRMVVSVLVKMAHSLDKHMAVSRDYTEMLRTLVQFSQLDTILPNRATEERKSAALLFYEKTKTLTYCRDNPQFWLQYAIAALVFEDTARSERFFQTAYSLSQNREHYDTHKIDNHYARLLLHNGARSASKNSAIVFFRKAREIIFRQIQTERLHYPYRVANGIGELFDSFASQFSTQEQAEIRNACLLILRKIGTLSSPLQSHPSVRRCRDSMERVCSVIDGMSGASTNPMPLFPSPTVDYH